MTIRRLHPSIAAVLVFVMAACQPTERGHQTEAAVEPTVVEVTALDYAFQAPDTISSGWATFRMRNQGGEDHFLLLNRLPEGKTLDDYGREVGVSFEIVWDSLKTGAMNKAEAGQLLGQLLPAWYAAVRQMGGVGLLGAGRTGETTVNLEPGTYVMECYVKTADGRFHSSLGMARQLVVASDSSNASPPESDINITLSNSAIAAEGAATRGSHTVAVRFADQPAVGLGNDVHLVRLEDGTEMDRLINWMDWMEVDGLREPSPARFLGGAQEMPIGYTSYFAVDLEPGRYAWISEPGAVKGMVKEFTVD